MKKNVVILGAGTAGTMMANHLIKNAGKDIHVTIIDEAEAHYYQPGFLFVPFGIYKDHEVVKPIDKYIPKDALFLNEKITDIQPDKNLVITGDNREVPYDVLVIATGTQIAPGEIEGMEGPYWQKNIFDFYTYEGAVALHKALENFTGGKLVINIAEMPIKCPVAPLEFAFLADDYFEKKGIRDRVEIIYTTPLSGAFTKPKATEALTYLLEEKNIKIVPDFAIAEVDGENKKIIDYGGEEVDYDLLVAVPTNMGAEVFEKTGLGDELNFVPTNKHTLQTEIAPNIFAIGDATNIPASKAGSVAHFEGELLLTNVLNYLKGEPLKDSFDGHANCFIETGKGKALLIDFNYHQEPVTGTFPLPGIGPLRLLEESRLNHMGKMAFKWIYWNLLIPGRHIPMVSPEMTMNGKNV
ncbi:MAG: FAD/NAD(P)-binding oxidoreductase [Schleiferiaceae bacterium]